ncbi:hypothetical protein TREMEDRAFT_60731 [Tremella mesenterica DSM 1558]|uniref:uncharacterized protein n=1 Tax=Tremella mesenterica (strain ATCC 24925 / CBS 8224 / DSM 1558 / NBRC 9311 / NRRL Y-6157 / RJB 2259-6 / UBC 559-6) TaxID=578456 RepID=UPI0003F49D30|nr:uncharacterized protein TREMEDRAFT_60731 [Tremella mesenterica DSM 1558]EIW71814.1 hypothetical protein TREMEDRAFT_60731 [Tremella mesenterica DSM 1558]
MPPIHHYTGDDPPFHPSFTPSPFNSPPWNRSEISGYDPSEIIGKRTELVRRATALAGLSWWQLLCVVVGGLGALGIVGWVWMKHRKKSRENIAKAQQLDKEEQQAALAEKRRLEEEAKLEAKAKRKAERKKKKRRRRRVESDSETESDTDSSSSFDSETETDTDDTEYDSVSDGGTIRRRRRPRRRYGQGRRGRRERDRRRGRRDRYPPRRRSLTPDSMENGGKDGTLGRRDSIWKRFSTASAVKRAALQLRQLQRRVEMRKEQEVVRVEERKGIERRKKVDEANRELDEWSAREREGRRLAGNRQGSGGSGNPLIPPVRTPRTQSTLSSGTPSLPIPPPRAYTRQPTRLNSTDPTHPSRLPHAPNRKPTEPREHLSKQQAAQLQALQARKPTKQSTLGLDHEVDQLLGGTSSNSRKPLKPALRNQDPDLSQRGKHQLEIPPVGEIPPVNEPVVAPLVERVKQTFANAFQSDWLSHPLQNASVPQSPRTTILIPMGNPRDRPTIPKGALAPAPPPKVRMATGSGGGTPGSGSSGGNKWANRLRERR